MHTLLVIQISKFLCHLCITIKLLNNLDSVSEVVILPKEPFQFLVSKNIFIEKQKQTSRGSAFKITSHNLFNIVNFFCS